jgi:hypothetical protein
MGMDGNGWVQTSSPFSPRTGRPRSSKTSTAMPSAAHWISPRHTGAMGLPMTKQETMSVPPEIDDRQQVALDRRVDEVEALRRSGEPVDVMLRRLPRSWVDRHEPALLTASMYLAEVPKSVIRSASASRTGRCRPGWNGEPS